MSFCIRCQACDQPYSLTVSLYESHVKGGALLFACLKCGFESPIDATGGSSLPELEKGADAKPLSEADLRVPDVNELGDEEVASLPPSSPELGASTGPTEGRAPSKSVPPPLPAKRPSPVASPKKPIALSRGLLFQVDDAPKQQAATPNDPAKGARATPRPPLKTSGKAVTRDLDFTDLVGDSEPPPAREGTETARAASQPTAGTLGMVALDSASSSEEIAGPPSIDMSGTADTKSATGTLAPKKRAGPHPPKKSPAPPKKEASEFQITAKEERTAEPRSSKRPGKPRSKAPRQRSASERPRKRSASERPPKARASTAPPTQAERAKEGRQSSGLALLVLLSAAIGIFFWMRSSKAPPESELAASAAQADDERQPAEPLKESPTAASTVAPSEPPDTTRAREPRNPAGQKEAAPREAAPQGEDKPEDPPKNTDEQAEDLEAPAKSEPEEKVEQPSTPRAPPSAPENEATEPFSKSAAIAALDAAVVAASACRQEGDPSGTALVTITFSPSGRVTSANLSGPPFAGTRTGGCIASRMRSARVPPFTGSYVTVSKSVVIR